MNKIFVPILLLLLTGAGCTNKNDDMLARQQAQVDSLINALNQKASSMTALENKVADLEKKLSEAQKKPQTVTQVVGNNDKELLSVAKQTYRKECEEATNKWYDELPNKCGSNTDCMAQFLDITGRTGNVVTDVQNCVSAKLKNYGY